jgi:hypothetical protein
MQVVPQQLKVEGDESIDGVACLKVTLTDAENLADKTTIWIDTKQRKAIRVEQVIPAFGNAKMTMKLNR